MKRMLDSNVYDRIVATTGFKADLQSLVNAGAIDLLKTHIQDDELAAIQDPVKRDAVKKIPGREVATTEFVIGTSRIGQARIGDGEAKGLKYSEIQAGNPKHIEDALIGLAASEEADVIVTEEKRLPKQIKKSASNLLVWNFNDLQAHVAQLKSKLANASKGVEPSK